MKKTLISPPLKELSKQGLLENKLIQSVFPYIKRTLIKTIGLDSITYDIIKIYLYENYKYYNLSDSFINSTYLTVGDGSIKDFIHYIIPVGKVMFKYHGVPLFLNSARYENNGNISFIKGTINIKKLLNDAIVYKNRNKVTTTDIVNYRKFKIIELVGMNKKLYQKNTRNIPEDGDVEDASGENTERLTEFFKTDVLLNYNHSDIYKHTGKNPFDKLYYSNEIMNVVTYINEWLKRKDWLLKRGLPWKRGILLHGPGGTGKSSFVRAVAELFGLPLFHFYLQTMDDQEFKSFWKRAVSNSPCIILLEDFDNVFNKRTAVNNENNLNFDTVLNTISGIQDANGILLMITTNHIENIDEAIGVNTNSQVGMSTRPGRIDRVVYFGKMDDTPRLKLIQNILNGWEDLIQDAYEKTKDYTAAQVQEYCIQQALIKLHEEG